MQTALHGHRQLVLRNSHRRHLQRHGTGCSSLRYKQLSKGAFPTFHCEQESVGKMKDETAEFSIEEFVGLRPNMYSLLYGGGKEKRTAKCITRANQRQMKHEQYKTSLFEGKATVVVGHLNRSYDHELYSEKIKKVVLCPFDDKRYVKNDGITTLAHGHYSI